MAIQLCELTQVSEYGNPDSVAKLEDQALEVDQQQVTASSLGGVVYVCGLSAIPAFFTVSEKKLGRLGTRLTDASEQPLYSLGCLFAF